MENLLRLTARVVECGVLGYTPADIPVSDLILIHEPWQGENGQKCLAKSEMHARILDKEAEMWQYRQDIMVGAEGFLAQRSQRFSQPILRIQKIKEYKG